MTASDEQSFDDQEDWFSDQDLWLEDRDSQWAFATDDKFSFESNNDSDSGFYEF